MYILNGKVRSVPYSIISYVLLAAILFTFTATKIVGIVQPMNVKKPMQHTAVGVFEPTKNTSPSVVELFTSEGCSSCPSADKLVAIAQSEFSDNLIVLSYHVDYWDKLGWKDTFSKSAYSERQREYAQHLHQTSVYTPQAIVDGTTEFVGSNKSALWNAISNNKNTSNFVIDTETPLVNDGQLSMEYNYASLKANENVVLELVLKNATTQVKRGENSGTTLSHINIVRQIVQKSESKGIATFKLPENFSKENYVVVAFIQNTESFEISNAKKIAII